MLSKNGSITMRLGTLSEIVKSGKHPVHVPILDSGIAGNKRMQRRL